MNFLRLGEGVNSNSRYIKSEMPNNEQNIDYKLDKSASDKTPKSMTNHTYKFAYFIHPCLLSSIFGQL